MTLIVYSLLSVLYALHGAVQAYEPLDAFLTTFPGQYDNEAQMLCTGGQTAEGVAVERLNFAFLQVSVPALPQGPDKATMYIEQFTSNDPALVYRRRIYELTDLNNGTITTRIYRFNDEFRYRNVLSYPALLLSLSLDEIAYLEGCDVIWSRDDTYLFSGRPAGTCYTADGEQLIEEYVTSSLDYFHLDYFFRNASTEEINLQLDLNLTKSKPKDILMTYSSVITSLESGAVIYAKFSPGRACSYFQDGQTVGGEITGWRVHDFVMQNTRLQFALYTGTAASLRTYIFSLDEFSSLRVYLVEPGSDSGQECILYSDAGSITSLLELRVSSPGQTVAVGTSALLKGYLDAGYPLTYVIDLGECFVSSGVAMPTDAKVGGVIQGYSVANFEDVSFWSTFPTIVGAVTVSSAEFSFSTDYSAGEIIVQLTDDIYDSRLICGIRGAADNSGEAQLYLRETKRKLTCDQYS